MTKNLRTFALAVVTMALSVAVGAQDLSSQRGESQNLGGLFGEKIDHKGIIINPTPHSLEMLEGKGVSILNGIALKEDAKAWAEELSFIKQGRRGAKLYINLDTKAEQKRGSYTLRIEKRSITITATEELGVFYAIQTLRQIV